MQTEFHILQEKFTDKMKELISEKSFSEIRKSRKIIKCCNAILDGELFSADAINKLLGILHKAQKTENIFSAKVLEIILLLGDEEFEKIIQLIDGLVASSEFDKLKNELVYIKSHIRLFELKNYQTVKTDAESLLNYLPESSSDILWKLSADYEEKETLTQLYSYAESLENADKAIIEFEIWLLQKEGKQEEIIPVIEKSLQNIAENEDNANLLSRLYLAMANTFSKSGQHKEVIETVEKGIEYKSNSLEYVLQKSEMLILRADSYLKLENAEQEFADLKNTVNEDIQRLQEILPEDERVISLAEAIS